MRRAFVFVLLAMVLLAAGRVGQWLFFTPAGALWTVERIPGLEVATLRGSLAGRMDMQGLRWRKGTKWVTIDHLDLDWSPRALLRGQILIRTLRVTVVQIHLASSQSPEAVPEISLPPMPAWLHLVHVSVVRLDLARLKWSKGQMQQLDLRSLSGDLAWTGRNLRSRHFRLALPAGETEGSLDLGWAARSLKSSGTSVLRGARVSWVVDLKPSMAAVMSGPVAVNVEGRVPLTVTADLLLEQHVIRLRNARVMAAGLRQPVVGNAVLALGPSSKPYRVILHGEGLYLPGSFKPAPAGPFGVDLWLEGSPRAYQGHIVLREPNVHWQLAGVLAGNEDGIRMTSLSGTFLGGRTTGGRLELAWHPMLRIAGVLTMVGVNPESLLPQLRGNLNATLGIRLAKEAGGLNGNLTLNLAPSHIYRQSLQGRARLSFAPRSVRVDVLDIRGPGLKLTAAGELERRIDFAARISRWAAIFPKLQGESRVAGWAAYVNGHWRGHLEGQARGLGFDAYRASAVHLAAASGAGGKSSLNLQASGVKLAGEEIFLDVRAKGALAAFDSRIEARWRNTAVHVAAKVSRRGDAWNAILQKLVVEDPGIGSWRLTEPAQIDWRSGRLAVAKVNVAGARGGSIRLGGQWNFASQHGHGTLHVGALPLDLAAASGKMHMKGQADLDLAARCAGFCTADGGARLRDAMFTWDQAGRAIRVSVSSWTARLHAVRNVLNVASRLSLANGFGSAQATATLPITLSIPFRWPPVGPVRGRFLFDVRHRTSAAGTSLGKTTHPGWQFGANLHLAGTWEHPAWSGRADLRNAEVLVPEAGISVTGISAQLQARGGQLIISQFHAASGKWSIGGQGVVDLSGFVPSHYRMKVTGKDFTVLNLPEVTAAVTPDIAIEGDPKSLGMTGNLTAAQFRILGDQIGGVRPSGDVVFVKTHAETRHGPALDISLLVALGDDAKVIMGGLRSDLQGQLQVRVRGGQPLRLDGVLRMVNGSYQIYGKSLKFTRGDIHFNGPPNLAALDVLALRRITATGLGINQETVQVGVKVTGTLQSPQVQLYSVPAMSDTDVLSYLVLGYPASGLQSQNTLLAAAAGQLFSATQATLFRQHLLGNAGLANLGFSSTGTGGLAGTMMTLGHYLTPKLYVSIGQSIFGAGTVAYLRYSLSRSIELQTEGGSVGSGVNLYYRIDLP